MSIIMIINGETPQHAKFCNLGAQCIPKSFAREMLISVHNSGKNGPEDRPNYFRGGVCPSLQHTNAFKVLEEAAMVFLMKVSLSHFALSLRLKMLLR